MRGNEFLDKMELINPAYVEAADDTPKIIKRSHLRWSAIVACFCILIGSTTAIAISGFGTQLMDFFTSRTEPGSDYSESGYVLSVQIEKVPTAALKGEIQEVPALIRQQFESRKPYMNSLPNSWYKTFESRSDAYDYVGFDGLKRLQWNLEEDKTTLDVQGTRSGNILSVSVVTSYAVHNIRLQFFADIYTENMEGEITVGTATTENVNFTESFYTTKNGKTLHIIEQTTLKSGYMAKDGYLTEDGVLYNLHISYLKEDADQAEELLVQWADLF